MATLPPNPDLTRFIKPTVETPFHIDYKWWKQQSLDLNIELLSHLCDEHREAYKGRPLREKIDWIKWETGEVRQVEGLQYIIDTHCSKQSHYISKAPTLVEAIFRVFLSTGNEPMTPEQLSLRTGYPADQILRVLSGRRVRKGIRPAFK
jgi:hypothetical protein